MNWPFTQKKINTRVAYTLLSAIFIMAGTLAAIQYAKGNYRFTNDGFVKETGLLSANSFPTGAQVFVDDRLVTATDDTLYLEPGTYEVKVQKDGYSTWQKTMSIEKELVAQTNALLFPIAPSISALTFTGAENISPSPDGQKVIFYTASASAEVENGLYVMDLGNNLLPLQRSGRQIADNIPSWDLAEAEFIWSPDSNEVLLVAGNHRVLLSVDRKQNLTSLPDVGLQLTQVFSRWEEEMYLRERQYLSKFPEEMIEYATQSARNIYVSPDKKKLMYTAEVTYTLPDDIIPPLPATNTQPETRQLEPNNVYIYDSEEDKNFLIGTERGTTDETNYPAKHLLATDLFSTAAKTLEASPSAFLNLQGEEITQTVKMFRTYYASLYSNSYQWFPDSRHIIHFDNSTIRIMEYDGTNNTTIFSGQFAENFVFPWPDGSKLVILTSFSPNAPLNLYAVELKR